MSSIQYTFPAVTAAVLSPNPVDINTPVLLQLTVVEQTVTLESEKLYSGEIYSGEAQ